MGSNRTLVALAAFTVAFSAGLMLLMTAAPPRWEAVASAPTTMSEQQMLEASVGSIVKISIDGCGYGSGVVLSSTLLIDGTYGTSILTAQHVVDSGKPLFVMGQHVLNFHLHANLDAATIYAQLPVQLPAVKVRSEPVKVGETLYALGFSGGQDQLWITRGLASAKDRGASAAHGDSGGAILDSNGMLVGTISAIDVGQAAFLWHHCHFVAAADMLDWLKQVVR